MLTRTKLITTVAALALAPAAAIADNHGDSSMNNMQNGGMYSGVVSAGSIENMLRTSNIIGGNVYTLSTDEEYDMDLWEEQGTFDTLDTDWELIGNIDDIVLSRDGQLTGLVVESGGFLGLGDEVVLLEMNDLRLIDEGAMDDYNWVTNISEEQFEDMPEVEENWF